MKRSYQDGFDDITGAENLTIEVRMDGKVIWIHIDGETVFRACRIDKLTIDDWRQYSADHQD